MKRAILATFLFSLTGWLVVGSGPRDKGQTVALAATPGVKAEGIARGGLLYDTWWKVVPGAKEPKDNQPLWASQTTNKRKGSVSWRCKECHGWDYTGKDGAYGSGSHKTGFAGVWNAAQKKSVDELAAILRGSANPQHNFSSVLRPEKRRRN